MSLLRTARRAAVASAVHGKVQRRQHERWAAAHETPPQAAPVPVAPPAAAPVAAPPVDTDDMLNQLERLGKLREAGVLTDAEFAAQKARILG